ncbi:MAG: iron hydrogenase small subunit [Veillonellales bacterium]
MKQYDYAEKAIKVTRREFLEIVGVVGAVIWTGVYLTTDLVQDHTKYIKMRIQGLYKDDANSQVRQSHNNPALRAMYRSFAEQPLSPLSEELFHTRYINRRAIG